MTKTELSCRAVESLKKTLQWKEKESFQNDRLALSIFISFIKMKLLPKKESAEFVFENFEKNPFDTKLEGKMEVWLELGLEEHPDLETDLLEKLLNISEIETRNSRIFTSEPKQDVVEVSDKPVLDAATNIKVETEIQSIQEHSQILVLHDFNAHSDFAIDYSLRIAKKMKGEITLLHFAKKGKDHIIATQKITSLLQKKLKESDFSLHAKVKDKEGNLNQMVLDIASDIKAKFIILPMENSISSDFNIIAGSNIPFLVVQAAPVDELKKIVFPIDDRRELKLMLNLVKFISKFFNVEYQLCKPLHLSIDAIVEKTTNNLNFVQSFMRQNEIPFKIVDIDCKHFEEVPVRCARETGSDMIFLLPRESVSLHGYVLSSDEKKIIENKEKIPVFCVNPLHGIVQGFSSGVMY